MGTSNHGCWLTTYEFEELRSFERGVKRGFTMRDVGGRAGFYTLLASSPVGIAARAFVPPGKCPLSSSQPLLGDPRA